ncbi:hypothetical protein DEJ25_05425 [Curtobacterium sp. MCPF17_011]|nr:hypothetical protein DEJ25_05425 [Curtobacterium sp. MCPF17_011]
MAQHPFEDRVTQEVSRHPQRVGDTATGVGTGAGGTGSGTGGTRGTGGTGGTGGTDHVALDAQESGHQVTVLHGGSDGRGRRLPGGQPDAAVFCGGQHAAPSGGVRPSWWCRASDPP